MYTVETRNPTGPESFSCKTPLRVLEGRMDGLVGVREASSGVAWARRAATKGSPVI